MPFVANIGVFALKSWPRKMKPLPFSPRALSSCASCPFPLPGGLLVTAKAVASGRKNTQNPSRATAAAAATRVAVGSGHLCAGTCSVAGMRGRSCSPYPHDPPRKRSRGAARLVKRASALADAQLPQGRSRVCASSLDACAPRADFFSRCGRAARRVRARASRAKAQCHGHRVTSREARDCHTGRVTTPDRGAVPRRRGGWSSAHARMQGEVWAHTVTQHTPLPGNPHLVRG